ncbi:MAG: oxygen-independent coproporphyrinogen III oxidase [Puniceicoccales bacterium]|nr:oxygen-independent coproporphyrinogen III oxidase [Puniceicoccales bacterium]
MPIETANAASETEMLPKVRLDLVRKYNVPGPRYTSYPTAVQFSEATPREGLLDDARADFAHGEDLSVYVHIPFCETLCWYCACNTITTKDHNRAVAYLDALEREIALWVPFFKNRPRIGQLHFGGGTPTFLRPQEIERLGAMIRAVFDFAPDAEVSVEIDPRRLTAAHVEAFRRAGANRVSLGVQDFDAGAQHAINRVQTLEMTADALRWVREMGYGSVNFDLIYGLPGQTEESFQRTLDAVEALAPDRMAVFSYAHVPWMRPAQKIFERTGTLPSPELKLRLLKLVIERLTAAGYAYVGLDHFARPDNELAAAWRAGRLQRNFQGYSTKAGLSILGLGVTSISQTAGAFRQNEKTVDAYSQRVAAGEIPVSRGVLLSDEDKRRREIIMRIMCDRELDFAALGGRFGVDFSQRYAPELARLAPLVDDGLVLMDAGHLRVPPDGWLFLRNIAMAFDAYFVPAEGRHSRTV